jgi:AsmA protein
MKKIIIWILALGGVLAVILAAAVVLVPKFIDVETYKPEIERRVSEATGRSFTLGSDFNVSVFPWVGVSFSDLSLGNLEGYGDGNFVTIKSFEVRMKLIPLLSKKIEIKRFVLDSPEVFLKRMADGRTNLVVTGEGAEFSLPETTTTQESKKGQAQGGDIALSSLEVDEFSIINGRISYVDEVLQSKNEITEITITSQDVSLERPITLLFQANVDGKPVSMQGSIGPLGKKIGRGIVNVDLAVNIAQQLKLNLSGSIEDLIEKQKLDLSLNAAPFSPRQLLASFNQQLPVQTADPTVLNKVALDLNIQGDPTNIVIKNSTVTLDDSRLIIEAAVKDMAKPDVTFMLDLDTIDLDRYLPPQAEKKAEAAKEEVTAKTAEPGSDAKAAAPGDKSKIDYAPLRSLVLNGEVTVGRLTAHGAKMQNLVMKIKGEEGVFDLDPFKIDLYQGNVDIVGKFNVQGEKPKAQVDLQVEKLKVGPLLRDSVKKDILEGTLQAAAGINFVGDEVEDIKKSLNGKGQLNFIDGAIVGIDLAEMVRSIQSGFSADKSQEKPRTDFAELKAPFVLTDGAFMTRNTRLLSPLLRLEMAGTADLVTEKLNFKVKPKVVGTLKGQGDSGEHAGITVPILVEGTFAEPKYSADLRGVVTEKALMDAAKDPEGTKKKAKELEESGKQLLKGLFGS